MKIENTLKNFVSFVEGMRERRDGEVKTANWKLLVEEEVREGIFRRTFSAGRLQVVIYRYRSGSSFEEHSHPEEQMSLLLNGRIEFEIGGERLSLHLNDVVYIPPNLPHSAKNPYGEDAVTLNIFTPPKEF